MEFCFIIGPTAKLVSLPKYELTFSCGKHLPSRRKYNKQTDVQTDVLTKKGEKRNKHMNIRQKTRRDNSLFITATIYLLALWGVPQPDSLENTYQNIREIFENNCVNIGAVFLFNSR